MGSYDCCGRPINKGYQVTNVGNSIDVILVCNECLLDYAK